MKIEVAIIEDLFDIFNNTLNSNAQNALKRILTTKLTNIGAIKSQQQIVKCFIENNPLFMDYQYPILHFREVFLMIEQTNFNQIISQKNPIKTLKSNKRLLQTTKGKQHN